MCAQVWLWSGCGLTPLTPLSSTSPHFIALSMLHIMDASLAFYLSSEARVCAVQSGWLRCGKQYSLQQQSHHR
ncbi:hypothetical protein GGS21DRAFT_519473 [Xylaria nigripes]|nr:hypothetical protein GGS21DRAFT_519473 [Xylaria nigripes]